MAIQDLPTPEMVTVTLQWLDPEKQRPIIERCPRVAPLLGDIAKAHADIVVFQNKGKQESPEMAKLRALTTALDNQHDRLARAVNHLLLGLIETREAEEDIEALGKLRRELLPQGLDINLKTYLAQAGEADLREKRISGQSKRLLETTSIYAFGREVKLWELVDLWGRVARELGDIESEKVRIKAGEAAEGSSGPARRAWVKIVSIFLQTLELETGLSEAERRAILEPLRNAEAKAAKKRALAKKKNVPFDPDAEEEGEETAS